MDDVTAACLGFSLCGRIGPATYAKLLEYYHTPQKAFFAPQSELSQLLSQTKQRDQFFAFRRTYDPQSALAQLQKYNVWFLTIHDPSYPSQLKQIQDAPFCLYGRGDRALFHFAEDSFIGVVGTRKPTPYGQQVAKLCGETYGRDDIVVVSGMALGIDAITQRSAIANGGRTIAVLGTDITHPYPRENIDLYEEIIHTKGIVISEHPPGYQIEKSMFRLRNRIIVGLSQAIVVVEGGEQSGSLITARYAADNGRDVYAVPGPIDSDMSHGPHVLLREGARLMQDPVDVLNDWGKNQVPIQKEKKQPIGLTDTEKAIYELLSIRPVIADELAHKTHIATTEVLSMLSLLEIRGLIKQDTAGRLMANT